MPYCRRSGREAVPRSCVRVCLRRLVRRRRRDDHRGRFRGCIDGRDHGSDHRSATAAATSAGGNQPKLLDLLGAAKLSEYKITYKITASGQGAEAMSGDQTWYFKPPKSRFDFSSTFGGQKTTISFFSLPDGSYYCFGGAGQPVSCLSVGGVGSPLDQNAAAVTQRQLIESPDKFGANFTETKTIAGQQALCYAVTGAAGTFSTGTFCYSKTGLALLSTFSVQGASWTMEATNVSTTVPDSDFTLPAKPIKP